MSLLLDALKKAAEKNSAKQSPVKNGDTPNDLNENVDQTEILDKTIVIENPNDSDTTRIDLTETYDNTVIDQIEAVEKATIIDNENITEIELAQIINAQKLAEAEDETEINKKNLPIDDIGIDSDPSLVLYEDDDPSLKLALSDEGIMLTDDDVTEFLGGNELHSRLDESELSLEDATELKLTDSTTGLNSDDPLTDFTQGKNDTASALDLTSITTNLGQTTNLNSLTNDATLSLLGNTSTQTFASDNYDRTLVKIDDEVSKVFTGLKSEKSGAAMTPDFAKKVFIQKSTSLRKQNYKIYGAISLVVLIAISILALLEMQMQIDEIDTSLARLKQNPVPSALRFKRNEKHLENKSILKGQIDTQALNLLKSLAKDNEDDNNVIAEQNLKANRVKDKAPTAVSDNEFSKVKVATSSEVEQELVSKKIAMNKGEDAAIESDKPIAIAAVKKTVSVKATKSAIKIKSSVVISKESIWLKDAYNAFESGNTEVAAMNYKKVLEKNPKNRDALLGQAAIYTMLNQNTLAINNYQAVLLENPKDPLAMTSLISASTMSPVESESRLKFLLRESPKATYLQFALGNVVSAQNRWQEAQQYYFDAFQTEPKNPDYAYNLAVSLEQINKSDVAINYYKQALSNAQSTNSSFNEDIIRQRIEVLSQ